RRYLLVDAFLAGRFMVLHTSSATSSGTYRPLDRDPQQRQACGLKNVTDEQLWVLTRGIRRCRTTRPASTATAAPMTSAGALLMALITSVVYHDRSRAW